MTQPAPYSTEDGRTILTTLLHRYQNIHNHAHLMTIEIQHLMEDVVAKHSISRPPATEILSMPDSAYTELVARENAQHYFYNILANASSLTLKYDFSANTLRRIQSILNDEKSITPDR